jgi:hypothetical protein
VSKISSYLVTVGPVYPSILDSVKGAHSPSSRMLVAVIVFLLFVQACQCGVRKDKAPRLISGSPRQQQLRPQQQPPRQANGKCWHIAAPYDHISRLSLLLSYASYDARCGLGDYDGAKLPDGWLQNVKKFVSGIFGGKGYKSLIEYSDSKPFPFDCTWCRKVNEEICGLNPSSGLGMPGDGTRLLRSDRQPFRFGGEPAAPTTIIGEVFPLHPTAEGSVPFANNLRSSPKCTGLVYLGTFGAPVHVNHETRGVDFGFVGIDPVDKTIVLVFRGSRFDTGTF